MEDKKKASEDRLIRPLQFVGSDGNDGNEDLSPEESFDAFERRNGLGPYAPDGEDD